MLNKEEETSLAFEKETLTNLNAGETIELNVRITKNKKYGFAQTTNLSKWRECVDAAVKLMKVNEPLTVNPELSGSKLIREFDAGARLISIQNEELINKAFEIMRGAKDVDKELLVSEIDMAVCNFKVRFANSIGCDGYYESGIINAHASCVLKGAIGYDISASKKDDIDFYELGKSAGKLCIKSQNPKKIESQKTDVTIDYLGMVELLDLLSKSLFASNVLENKSVFKNKVGKEVLSPKISIIDDATLLHGIESQPFDAEGTCSKRNELIINGMLKGFLHDKYTAKQMGVESTGNCASMAIRPSIKYTNLIVKEGNASEDELFDDCIYAYNLMGSHMANPVSGDFALNLLNAFEIKNGKWAPIRDAMLTGNLFELFKNVKAVGKKAKMRSGIATPLIKFSNVQVVA